MLQGLRNWFARRWLKITYFKEYAPFNKVKSVFWFSDLCIVVLDNGDAYRIVGSFVTQDYRIIKLNNGYPY